MSQKKDASKGAVKPKKSNKKIHHHTAYLIPEANTGTDITTFLNPEAHMLYPGKDEYLKRLQHTLVLESKNPDMLHLVTFCIKYNITRKALTRLANLETQPHLFEALEHFKICIAHNRRVGAMKFTLNGAHITAGIENLDLEERESMEWRATLTAKSNNITGTGIVYIAKDANGNLNYPQVISKEEMTYDNKNFRSVSFVPSSDCSSPTGDS